MSEPDGRDGVRDYPHGLRLDDCLVQQRLFAFDAAGVQHRPGGDLLADPADGFQPATPGVPTEVESGDP